MSLATFEKFLVFAETAIRLRQYFPEGLDPIELESVFVSHGAVLLHSHMEQCIRKAVALRCDRCTDNEIRGFARKSAEEKTGKLKIEFLKQTLERFCRTYRDTFHDDLTRLGINFGWDSIVNHRKVVAHEGQPAAMTLSELRQYYDEIRAVLGHYCQALGLEESGTMGISTLIRVN